MYLHGRSMSLSKISSLSDGLSVESGPPAIQGIVKSLYGTELDVPIKLNSALIPVILRHLSETLGHGILSVEPLHEQYIILKKWYGFYEDMPNSGVLTKSF